MKPLTIKQLKTELKQAKKQLKHVNNNLFSDEDKKLMQQAYLTKIELFKKAILLQTTVIEPTILT